MPASLFQRDSERQARRRDLVGGHYDRVVLGAALALTCIGVVMVASSSVAVAEGKGLDPLHFLWKHLMFLGIGGTAAVFVATRELRDIERYSLWMLIACFVLLAVVFVPGLGRTLNGARRWITLGFTTFQVVEAVKLLLIVWLASYLVRHREQVQSEWLGLIKPMAIAGLLVAMLLLQPDFGSATLLCAIAAGMVWLGGVKFRYLLSLGMLVVPALAALALAAPYRVRRLTSFTDPWADPFNDGFQLTQALIAIGRGEVFGVGLGGSVQKLFYLPEAHTDFILSVIGEEFGFVGLLVVIALFVLLAGRAFQIGLRAMEMGRGFAGYCAFGVGLWISLQALVSMGVNLGLLPTKGLTLPLISAGGSSMVMTLMALGLLLRVSFELERASRQVAKVRNEDFVNAFDPNELLGQGSSSAATASRTLRRAA